MKSMLSAFSVTVVVIGVACTSNSGVNTGTGDGSLSAGTSNAAGSQSKGGSQSAGGSQGRASTPAQGGVLTTGGVKSTGGSSGSAGARWTGGEPGIGGAGGSGGTPSSVTSQGAVRARKIHTRGFTFDALEAGSSGEPVLLLHGFPDTSLEWSALMPVLAASGYHCLAPDQRGYSPGARPTEVDAYNYQELVADAFAFGDELGPKFHIIAHDWAANVAWLMLQKDPSRVASFTTIAVPHYQVWARNVYSDPGMAGYLSMLNTWMTPDQGESFWTASAMRNSPRASVPSRHYSKATVTIECIGSLTMRFSGSGPRLAERSIPSKLVRMTCADEWAATSWSTSTS